MSLIRAISISDRKGIRKVNIDSTNLIKDHGLEHDAHAGQWHRQVSLLAQESIDSMRAKGLDVVAGNFAENLTTEGVDLTSLPVGTHITIGNAELVISQHGKICHTRCAIYHQAGDCVMPREGIFAVVINGGTIKVGDRLTPTGTFSQAAAIVTTAKIDEGTEEDLKQRVISAFQPVFIRRDTLSPKEGGSLAAILDDLTMTQKIAEIVIIDPAAGHGLSLAGLPREDTSSTIYRKHGSRIHYCRSVDELTPA